MLTPIQHQKSLFGVKLITRFLYFFDLTLQVGLQTNLNELVQHFKFTGEDLIFVVLTTFPRHFASDLIRSLSDHLCVVSLNRCYKDGGAVADWLEHSACNTESTSPSLA